MPRKVRELRADVRKAGLVWRPGKGSHGNWEHPKYPQVRVTISGHDGDDAKQYQEHEVRAALDLLRRLQEAE